MAIYVKISYISRLIFLWFLNMILSDALILPVSPLQTPQVMTSQIRSHTEYLKQTLHSFSHFVVRIYEKFSLDTI